MQITAEMVKNLREQTGAGMMECKKALTAASGDMEKARLLLREKGAAGAAKREGRTASEGVVAALKSPDGMSAGMVELNSETDFVARNSEFKHLARELASRILSTTAETVDALLDAPAPDGGQPMRHQYDEVIARLREKIALRRFARWHTDTKGIIETYVHLNDKIGVMVELSAPNGETDEMRRLAKDISMHIAASRPQFLSREDVPEAIIREEMEIQRQRAAQDPKNANKPDAVLDNIAKGRLSKYYEETCLLDQPFVRDPAQSVQKVLAAAGSGIEVRRFLRYMVGEELEG
ncbi:MAG: translation elongation factor Ts [Armatimonadetes bacterium]|nr:translation elongation factor Ts [Armatimonadota bacterium]